MEPKIGLTYHQISFADLEEHIFEAEQLNDSFHFFRARESVADSEAQIELMEGDVEGIRQGVAQLVEQESVIQIKFKSPLIYMITYVAILLTMQICMEQLLLNLKNI